MYEFPEIPLFQVMPPRGGNYNLSRSDLQYLIVSSHAPARGQHIQGKSEQTALFQFQVMPPRGGNVCISQTTISFACFKSCPREGATEAEPEEFASPVCFKSCPREGATLALIPAQLSLRVSSHAPARGQQPCFQRVDVGQSFKSCPREGATVVQVDILHGGSNVSSHAPARGQLHRRITATPSRQLFQVMPPRGGNYMHRGMRDGYSRVSSHAPARGQLASFAKFVLIPSFQVMPPRGGNSRCYNDYRN